MENVRQRPYAAAFPALAAALLMVCAVPSVCSAEIYGYIDSSGTFTYSNLPPPKDARVTDVIPEDPASRVQPSETAVRLAQVAALNDRVRLLELENERARHAPLDFPAPPAVVNGCTDGYGDPIDCAGGSGPYFSGLPYAYYPTAIWPAYYPGGRGNWRGHGGYQGGYGHGGGVHGGHGGHGGPAHASVGYGGASHGSAGHDGGGARR